MLPNAPTILLRNWYGWFTRIERGLYRLTPEGTLALARWSPAAPQRQRQISRNEKHARLTPHSARGYKRMLMEGPSSLSEAQTSRRK